MNDWEFMSYFSQLVDVCFAQPDNQTIFEVVYRENYKSQSWTIDSIENFFEQDYSIIGQKIEYEEKALTAPNKIYGW